MVKARGAFLARRFDRCRFPDVSLRAVQALASFVAVRVLVLALAALGAGVLVAVLAVHAAKIAGDPTCPRAGGMNLCFVVLEREVKR